MDNEMLRPPPPLAPEERVSENLVMLLFHDNLQFNQEELEMMVATRNLGLRTMPLQEARQMVDFGKKGVPGTMFLQEFLTATDDHSTEVSTGREPQPQD